MTPDEKIYFDEQLSGLCETMDAKEYESTWLTGRTMTMEQAIELALVIE